MDRPITVSKLAPGVALAPPATVICPLAEAVARFTQETLAPAAEQAFGAKLTAVAQASGYVCRGRNGTRKLSEHAFGNALDIAGFTLADGRRIEVRQEADPAPRDFLASIRSKACGLFKTVLGPGSDPDHALHLHLDLQRRRAGSTFCS